MRLATLTSLAVGLALSPLTTALYGTEFEPKKTCEIAAAGDPAVDDAPAIRTAFQSCSKDARVVFADKTYHINSVLDIRNLKNVKIDVHGTLLWSTDIDYWLANSMPMGYQNQSTAMILGGDNVHLEGFGKGTFDGNGDAWYLWIDKKHNKSNWPGRPHQITFNNMTNSRIENLSFLRSQMWTMTLIYSQYVDLNNIFVNNTGNHVQSFNNDGADTVYSSHINFDRWTVYNGDDSIALKANSTDISITNSAFYDGSGIALGSIGQFRDVYETIERVRIENVTVHNCIHAAWVKTWTNDQNGYAPNGGGGGLGFASNITIKNVTATRLRGGAFTISQCTRFSGAPGDGNCTNSKFRISDINIDGIRGTSRSPVVTSLQCSAVAPCEDISIRNVDITLLPETTGKNATEYLCGNARDLSGFNCTGTPCVRGTAIGECSSAGGIGAMLPNPPKGIAGGSSSGGAGGSSTGAGNTLRIMMSGYTLAAILAGIWVAF
ncbi:galacturan 1,4-alpha-galacturonidase B [Microdochium bolleyi]|uniref:Galacturan 1,4-alpha-galacturonidase B n=1 Tax=Microdochium bolleyi TaxID=196109 RepID=A0A136IR69_9PEZI|nr:galacturan 1,4-alpha-galacturonidase B [Microdochium bolleyi]